MIETLEASLNSLGRIAEGTPVKILEGTPEEISDWPLKGIWGIPEIIFEEFLEKF